MGTLAATPCRCGCVREEGDDHHRIAAALGRDDVDAALSLGLLTTSTCASCSPDCRARLDRIRDERQRALAARDRYRARNERRARRDAERDARRPPAAPPVPGAAAATTSTILPGAAAAALARAKARAAGRRDR